MPAVTLCALSENSDFEIVLAPGCLLNGKYMVLRLLGEGGMGLVYEAERMTDREIVAIKVLRQKEAKVPSIVERFMREARALKPLHSPAIAKVLEVGDMGAAGPYIVMERLNGRDLADELAARGRLPEAEAARILFQTCTAVRAAHAAGIIHRDLKPENIFLHCVGPCRRVKLLDFGISKFLSEHSMTGQAMLGTPRYMSPEQIRSTTQVDERADIWSLGVILFELVTGALPFAAANPARLINEVLNAPVPPPQAYAPHLSQGMADVILKALSKNPEARYASAEEMAKALIPHLGAPPLAPELAPAPPQQSGIFAIPQACRKAV